MSTPLPVVSRSSHHDRRPLWKSLLVFAVIAASVYFVQRWMHADAVERGRYSDDATHLMNGLLVRDYLMHALGSDPVHFAEQYYLHYPKIAPLMWPPLFHIVLGLCLLPGGPAAATALALVGLAACWVTFRLHQIVHGLVGPIAAVAAAALFLTTPVVMSMTSVVMLDVVIAAFAIEAALWLARFARSGATRHAAIFGACAAMACLTKGNGVAVVLMPLLIVPLCRRFDLLRRPGLYVAAAIVVVTAVPILAVSAMFDARIGDFGLVSMTAMWHRLVFFLGQLNENVGLLTLMLAILGAVAARARARTTSAAPGDVPMVESLIALVLAALLFHIFSPHVVSLGRYLTMAIAPIIALAILGAMAVARVCAVDTTRRTARIAFVSLVVGAAVVERAAIKPFLPMGYRDVIQQLNAAHDLGGHRVLIVSDELGEGAAVTEAAALELQPPPTMIRGSKLLASGDWGTTGSVTHDTPTAVLQDLEDLHVDYVLVDRSPSSADLPYFDQIVSMTEGSEGRLEPVKIDASISSGAPSRPLELFRVTRKSAGAPKSLRIDLAHTLGRTIQR